MGKNNILQLEPLYRHRLKERNYQIDAAQLQVLARLQAIVDQLQTMTRKRTWMNRLKIKRHHNTDKTAAKQSLYLWGGVGRGKTYLLDFFYEVLPVTKKLRLHYYQFMQEIHATLKKNTNEKNPLKIVAQQLASRTQVLFLDEFFVSDITDAMILYGLLSALFESRMVLITTSNFSPRELYKDGLQRQRFLPAIALIEQHAEVIEIRGTVDYRTRHIKNSGSYHTPCDEKSEALMQQCFTALAAEDINPDRFIKINDRTIDVIMHTPNIVWFNFKAICQTARAATDYIMIAHLYHTVLISEVPVFAHRDDAARRFIQLVDEFYDQNVILVLSAATPADQLYQDDRLKFEFNRTVSRLHEMQSREYWSNAHTN